MKVGTLSVFLSLYSQHLEQDLAIDRFSWKFACLFAEWMIFHETTIAFVIYKFSATSYWSLKQYDTVIFLEMNSAKNLQVLVNTQWMRGSCSKGEGWRECLFRNVIQVVILLQWRLAQQWKQTSLNKYSSTTQIIDKRFSRKLWHLLSKRIVWHIGAMALNN